MTNGQKQEIQWQIGFSATNTVANEHKMTEIQWQIVKCTPKYSGKSKGTLLKTTTKLFNQEFKIQLPVDLLRLSISTVVLIEL